MKFSLRGKVRFGADVFLIVSNVFFWAVRPLGDIIYNKTVTGLSITIFVLVAILSLIDIMLYIDTPEQR